MFSYVELRLNTRTLSSCILSLEHGCVYGSYLVGEVMGLGKGRYLELRSESTANLHAFVLRAGIHPSAFSSVQQKYKGIMKVMILWIFLYLYLYS